MPYGMSTGSGSKGSLSSLTRKTHKGSGNKGSTASLTRGTKRTGKQPFPSMARGPVRERARSAGVG
jgi:hypothetical protein